MLISDPKASFTPGHPVVAALPDGGFAIAYADVADGSSQGIALRRYDPKSAQLGPVTRANVVLTNAQRDPDIVWTGNALAVAWIDDSDPTAFGTVKVRTFSADLAPTSDEVPFGSPTGLDTGVALAAFAGE